ncbi:MAG: fused MFS/spermidine synthase [Pseudonocardia sp.]|nr:fused MFS/spermidine synthase [Pseudonocardia sp.]
MSSSSRPERTASAVIRAEVDHGLAELVGDPDRSQAWTLLLDGTAQSHVDLDDPLHLEFEYVRRMAHVVDTMADPYLPVSAVHLGGGAWTLPRYVAATRPGSTQRVVDLDRALIELVRTRLPVDDPGIEVHSGDARARLTGIGAGQADLLVLDVFAGARTPAHLTSIEFVRDVHRVLAPGGTYVANVADGGGLDFARSQVATAAAVFAELALMAVPDLFTGRRFGNLVLVASDQPLPVAELTRRAAGDPFRATVLGDAGTRRFAGRAAPRTDRTATPSPDPPAGFFGR